LRACWQRHSGDGSVCDSLSLARALDFAVTHQAGVINLSLSGPPDPLLASLLDAAETRGITLVGAYDRRLPRGGFPASHAGVVAVAEESWSGLPAGVYGAPGDGVPTTTAGGHWSFVNGSSFAAAHVSGLFALLRERGRRRSGPPALVAARDGAVDACATVLGAASACDRDSAQASRAAPTVGR
jgi:subtilisin family serine protease